MGTGPPSYCPSCGEPLSSTDHPDLYHCHACDDLTFDGPSPNARVTVVDRNRLLLVEIANEARLEDPPYEVDSEWMTPGGHIERGEQPREAAARELREETGLVAAPESLVLFEAVTREVVEGRHGLVLLYAVAREETTGTLEAADDASATRFWPPGELAASEGRFRVLHDEPDEHRDLGWLLGQAKHALADR